MAASRSARVSMTQEALAKWADKREADAERIAKTYRKQARDARELITEVGCSCNPSISLHTTSDGPKFDHPALTHSLDCTEN